MTEPRFHTGGFVPDEMVVHLRKDCVVPRASLDRLPTAPRGEFVVTCILAPLPQVEIGSHRLRRLVRG